MGSVEEALRAREERKKKEEQEAKESYQAKKAKVDSAVEAYKNRKKNSAQGAVSDLSTRINAEIDIAKKGYSPSWGTGSLKNTLDYTRESRVNIGNLTREVESYKNYFDEDTYNDLSSRLQQLREAYDSTLGFAELREQFDSEDTYNKWYEGYKPIADMENSALSDFSFGAYSQLGANIENPTYAQANASDNWLGWKNPFKEGEKINNIVTFSRDNADIIAQYLASADSNGSVDVLGDYRYRFLTDKEVRVYNYYLGKGDTQKADEYLALLDDTLNQRWAGQMASNVEGSKLLEMTFALSAGLDQFASGISNLDNLIMGTEADPTTAVQYANSIVRENQDGACGVVYDLVNTTGNMLPSILVGSFTGGLGGAATLGTSAVGNGYAEMRRLGYDEQQSRNYGLLVGASETVLQYALGGIGKLGGKLSGNVVGKFVSSFDNALARTAIKLGGNMASEGLEEAIQTALEPAFKSWTTGAEFDPAEWEDIWYSALLGALSAGVLEGAPTIAGTTASSIKAQKVYGADAQALVTESLDIDPNNAHAQRMQARLDNGKNVSGYQLNRLVEANETALVSQDKAKMKSAVEARLTELGETGDISKLADVIVKAQSGGTLTHAERSLLVNSKYGRRASTELNPKSIESGAYTSKWAENLGTERINTEAYNKGLYDLATEQAGVAVDEKKASVTKNPTAKENTTEAKFEVSTDGKTRIGDLEVSIKEIASVKDGKVTLRLEDGSTVDASDVEYGSTEEGLLYENVVEMNLNAATANAFIKGYDPSMSVQEYVLGFREAYRYGEYGFPTQEMSADGFSAKLSESQKNLAYNLGKTDSKYKVESKQAKIASTSAIKAGKDSQKTSQKGKLHNTIKPTTERQKASLKALGVVANTLGIDIYTFESAVVNGKRQGANGWFDPKDGSIHIDIHAGINGEGTMLFTAAHELTHFIREWSPTKFKVFADFLLEQYGKKGVSVDALVREQIAKAKRNGRDISYDTAYEEVIADSCEAMLADGDAVAKIAELKAKDKTLWQKIKEYLTNLVARIKSAYEGMSPDSVEGNHVAEMLDTAERLKALWTEALVEASDNYTSAEKTLSENGIAVDSKTESASLMSVRDLLDSKQQQKVAESLATRFGVTVEEAKGWISAETSLASLILNPKYSQYLDYTADPSEVAIKSNSDYPQGTVDFSNICKKRRDFTEVMNRVLRNFPNHVFEATDLAKIRTIMMEEKMEVACGICYVEDRRQLDSIVAQNFIDSLALYRSGSKTRPDGNAFNTNQLKALKLIDGDTYTPSIYELISLEGRNALKAKNPAMEEAWVKFNNARGMQSVRLLLNDAEYKRQILKYSPTTVKSKNNLGGLRIYSFSDMEMFHLIDIIQVITDSATVGLSLQGYTKVNEYAKAVKDTGEKLNRSLIPKGTLGYHIENGKVVLDFDTVEGIDINHKDFFDNIDNPNVGNIVIGINREQIRAAMTSKFIDQIIPFHTGQSNEVLGEKGIASWVNYKDFQSETDIATGKKSSHQINIYTEVIEAAEKEGKPITNKVEFVNKFLQVCKENNLQPRFSEFLNVDENGDYVYTEGYHKFLVDFKTFDQNTGEYLPQKPVKPIFDDAYLTGLLEDYVKSQKVKDAKVAEAMPKVLDRITKEIVGEDVKFSARAFSEDFTVNTLNSFGIEKLGDYIHVQRQVLTTLEKENFFTDVDNRSRVDVNEESGMIIETNKSGIDETFSFNNFVRLGKFKKIAKLATIRELPKVIKYGHIVADDVANKYDSVDQNKKFTYIEYSSEVDGKEIVVKLAIKKSPQKNKFWVHSIYTIENVSDSPASTNDGTEAGHITADSKGIITQPDAIVKEKVEKNSLRNVEPIENNDYVKMYHHFGSTKNYDVAGYMLGNGVMLDFSGKHWGDDYSTSRQVDHRDIQEVLGNRGSNNGINAMIDMLGDGNIRLMPEVGGINLAVKPNDAQMSQLRGYINHFKGEVEVDIDRVGGDTIHSFSYTRGTSSSKVLADIKAYFDAGIVPAQKAEGETDIRQFLYSTKYSDRDTPTSITEADVEKSFEAVWDSIVELTDGKYKDVKDFLRNYTDYEQVDYWYGMFDEVDEDILKELPFTKIDGLFHDGSDNWTEKWTLGDVLEAYQNGTLDKFKFKPKVEPAPEKAPTTWKEEAETLYTEIYNEVSDHLKQKMPSFEDLLSIEWDNLDSEQPMRDVTFRVIQKEQDRKLRNTLEKKAWAMKDLLKHHLVVVDFLKRYTDRPDLLYSDRDPDSFSNRSLLANALESVAQNDVERNKLKQYKEKIDLINSEQAKLQELREQIKGLSFAKGPRDTKAIKDLQFEANQAANRITTYDKQLLSLESTKALKDVLEREKQMAYKRAEQRGKDALAAYRERATKTQRELMTRYQESRKKGVENRHKTAMRHKIKDITSELNTLLLNPTAKKHIKEELRKEVANALSAINMDTVGADERVAMYNDLISRERNPDVIAELVKTRDNIQLQGEKLKDKLDALQNAYEKIKSTDDIELSLAYQEVIQNSIKAVSEKVGNTSIRNMSLEQLEMVYDLFKMIRQTIRNANKAFKENKGLTIMQMAEAVNDQVRTVGGQPYKRNVIVSGVQKVGWTFLKPYVAFRTIGSITLTNMYKELRAGEDTFYGDIKEAQAFIEEQYEKHGYKSWDMKKTKTFTAKSGKSFDLTLEQMMTLYAYSRREQAHKHIIEGGIVFENAMIVEKNKWGIPIKYEVTTKGAFNLSEETFAEIANSLSDEQKAFVDEMQTYLSDNMGAKGNEVSMELLGIKLFKEKNYLPIKSSQYYMNFKAEEAGEVKLRSPAFSKETVQHANNPIVLHNFTDLWAEHINDMSMYHSFVLALEDFTRVYNYKTRTDAKVETMDTKATLETAYPGATKYINKFLKDLNGGVRAETVGWAEKLTSLAKKGAVLGSASVAIQQPSAVMRAMAYVNPKYFVATTPESMNLAKHKQDWEELKKYAPIAGIKEMGRFDVGMGQETVDWIKSNKTVMNKAEDILSTTPAYMDEVTWVSIWNAVKRETVHTRKDLRPNSEEFLKVAGERFTDVVSLSQVYDSVFSRSDLMRNKSWIAKAVTAFMAEPTTASNMLWDAWVQGKRTGSVKGLVKTTSIVGSAWVSAVVLNSALKAIILAMRDDDDDESYAEKYLEHFFGDLNDNLNPLTLVPFAKDIVSIFKGYDVERMDMALFSDLKSAIDAFDSDSKTTYEKWSGLIGAISAFFGVPVKNVERDIKAAVNVFFGKRESTTKQGLLDAISKGWTGDAKSNGQQLYEAMVNGDTEQIERVKGRFKDQNAINSAIRLALRENDPRIKEAAQARYNGDIAEYMRIAKAIIAEGHFKQDDVVAAINSEINLLKKGEGTSESSESKVKSMYEVSDYYAALVGRDEATAYVVKEDIIKTGVANGKNRDEAEESFNSSFVSYLRDEYESGVLSNYDARNMLVKYGGKTEEEALSKVRYWDFKKEYPDYDLSESAVTAYYEEVEPSGIKVSVYYDYCKRKADCKGSDNNGDGRTDSGSVKAQVMNVIDSLPISNAQKDTLYYLNGWSASTLYEAPWH